MLADLTDDEVAALDEAHADETHARNLRMQAASAEQSFAGEVRRAIDATRRNPTAIAAECGLDVATLEAFRCGDVDLPWGAVDRLLQVVGLQLVPVEAGRNAG